jgi:hypothetical protein
VNDPDFYRINEDAGLEHVGSIGGSIPGRVFPCVNVAKHGRHHAVDQH